MGCVLVSAFCMHVYGVGRGGGGDGEDDRERGSGSGWGKFGGREQLRG